MSKLKPSQTKASPVDYVVHHFKGLRRLARKLDRDPSVISHWRSRVPRCPSPVTLVRAPWSAAGRGTKLNS